MCEGIPHIYKDGDLQYEMKCSLANMKKEMHTTRFQLTQLSQQLTITSSSVVPVLSTRTKIISVLAIFYLSSSSRTGTGTRTVFCLRTGTGTRTVFCLRTRTGTGTRTVFCLRTRTGTNIFLRLRTRTT